jgi:hypothetical protein
MELLDSDEERGKLLRQSARHREALEGEVRLISANTEKIITNALIIGGSLALSYYFVRQLSGGGKSKKSKRKAKRIQVVHAESPEVVEVERAPAENVEPGILGTVGAALVSQASMFLLNLAKEKLMEYLDSVKEQKQQEE